MKAMILAAGLGSRLGSLTLTTPKCLIDINGKPMLRIVSESLATSGVTEVIINIHHHFEQVRAYASSSLNDLFSRIEFSYEPVLLGTGGGLKAASDFFREEKYFLLVNADIYCAFPLSELLSKIQDNQNLGCLAVMQRTDSSYLEFDDEGIFCGWKKSANFEDSLNKERLGHKRVFAFCGQQALSTKIFHYLNLETTASFSIIETYMRAWQANEKIGYWDIASTSWFDMGTPSQLEALKSFLKPPC